MKKIFKRDFKRNDTRSLFLYGYNEHTETASKQLSSGNGNFISLVNKFKNTLGIISTKQIKDKNINENENENEER